MDLMKQNQLKKLSWSIGSRVPAPVMKIYKIMKEQKVERAKKGKKERETSLESEIQSQEVWKETWNTLNWNQFQRCKTEKQCLFFRKNGIALLVRVQHAF